MANRSAHHLEGHRLDPTTRTLEIRQVQEINDRLRTRPPAHGPTALILEVAGRPLIVLSGQESQRHLGRPGQRPPLLSAGAVLIEVLAEGPPSFPYLWGRFRGQTGGNGALVAALHTATLTKLSRALLLPAHRWGLDSVTRTHR